MRLRLGVRTEPLHRRSVARFAGHAVRQRLLGRPDYVARRAPLVARRVLDAEDLGHPLAARLEHFFCASAWRSETAQVAYSLPRMRLCGSASGVAAPWQFEDAQPPAPTKVWAEAIPLRKKHRAAKPLRQTVFTPKSLARKSRYVCAVLPFTSPVLSVLIASSSTPRSARPPARRPPRSRCTCPSSLTSPRPLRPPPARVPHRLHATASGGFAVVQDGQ